MNIKSSNTKTLFLLAGLSLLVILLLLFGGQKNQAIQQKKGNNKEVSTPYTSQKTTLNFIEITLSEKNYNKLKKYRNKGLSVGVLSKKEKKYVAATITFNGKNYKADIRLKGDWTDHLTGDKWSFRVKLKGGNTILGMRKFSIHHPKTRGYINEWLFHKASKAEHLIGLRYSFVESALHIKKEDDSFINKNLGIYAIEETFDKRMLENNKRKESIILKFSEENWWSGVKKRIKVGEEAGLRWDKFKNYKHGRWSFPVIVFSESKMLEDPTLHSYFKLSKTLLEDLRTNRLSIDAVFNVKQLAMHNALANLFGAFHGDHIINHRFYYNPITSRLEPISFDGNSGQPIKKYHHFRYVNLKRDSIYRKELIIALRKVSQPAYLKNLIQKNEEDLDYYQKLLKREFLYSGLKNKNFYSNQEIIIKEIENITKQKTKKQKINTAVSSEIKAKLKNLKKHTISNWKLTNTLLKPENLQFKNLSIYRLSRKNNFNSSYTIVEKQKTECKKQFSESFLVKKTEKEGFFAIRFQVNYPNRLDAIFNLTDGTVSKTSKIGEFFEEKASITKMENGWYLCTLKTNSNYSALSTIIGSTNKEARTNNWESKTQKNTTVYIAIKE